MKATAKKRVPARHGLPILALIDALYMIIVGICLVTRVFEFEGIAFLLVGFLTLIISLFAKKFKIPNFALLFMAFFNLPVLKIIGFVIQSLVPFLVQGGTVATSTHADMWDYIAVHSGALLLITTIKWFVSSEATDRISGIVKGVVLILFAGCSAGLCTILVSISLIPLAFAKGLVFGILAILGILLFAAVSLLAIFLVFFFTLILPAIKLAKLKKLLASTASDEIAPVEAAPAE